MRYAECRAHRLTTSSITSGGTAIAKRTKQPKRFWFFLNPYHDVRFTRCPKCEGKTKLRKLPLVIHVEPYTMLAINKTCRFCPYCDLLIAHKDQLDELVASAMQLVEPDALDNAYIVLGTLDRPDWKRGVDEPVQPAEMLERMYIFKDVWDSKVMSTWVVPTEKQHGTQ